MSLKQMLPPEVAATLPPLYAQEKLGKDATVHVKFFTPWTNWTWYATEYNPEDRIFFGYVDGHCGELGYFSLDEMLGVKGPFGLEIERDEYFTPKPLREIMENLG